MKDAETQRYLFNLACDQATEVAEHFGLGVLRSDDFYIVYITSPHMGSTFNKALPTNAQHYLKIYIDEYGRDLIQRWELPVVSNIGTIKLDSFDRDDRHLADFDPDEFARVTAKVVDKVNELERRLDAKDQEDHIQEIAASADTLLEVVTGTNPIVEAILHPCDGPENT